MHMCKVTTFIYIRIYKYVLCVLDSLEVLQELSESYIKLI
jgi:hypothetical protein